MVSSVVSGEARPNRFQILGPRIMRMDRAPTNYVLRIAPLAAVVASLSILLAPPAPAHTPYTSALSSLVISPVYAMGCPDKICLDRATYSAGAGYKCLHLNGKGCRSALC